MFSIDWAHSDLFGKYFPFKEYISFLILINEFTCCILYKSYCDMSEVYLIFKQCIICANYILQKYGYIFKIKIVIIIP